LGPSVILQVYFENYPNVIFEQNHFVFRDKMFLKILVIILCCESCEVETGKTSSDPNSSHFLFS